MAYESEIEKLRRRYDEKPEQWFAALADAHRKAGDLEQAIRIVEKGIKQRPNYVSGHIVLGRCLVDQGEDDKAEKVFEEVLELDAENIIALKVLGDVSERRGNREAARRWLGRLLEVDPMNDEAREMLDRVSQPQSMPVINPVNPDAPIITESAARAAGVASTRSTKSEGQPAQTPPVDGVGDRTDDEVRSVFKFRDSDKSMPVYSRTSVRELLDAQAGAKGTEKPPAKAQEEAKKEPTDGDLGFLIERAEEAFPSGEYGSPDEGTFETFTESETKMVSFDEPAAEADEPAKVDDSSDLAAGTLDFVTAEPADRVPAESDSIEVPLELEMDAEPGDGAPTPEAGDSPEDDLPEDVASIFASAPPVTSLSPAEIDETPARPGQDDADQESGVEDTAGAAFLSAAPDAGADFLTQGVEPADEPAASSEESLWDWQDAGGDSPAAAPEPAAPSKPSSAENADLVAEEELEEFAEPAASVAEGRSESEPAPLDASVADVLVDDSIVGSIAAPDSKPEPEPHSPLVTETMAEVYASQGLFDQARDVYRQLLADSPGDEGLQKRLGALEERARSAAARRSPTTAKRYSASDTGGESVRSMLASLLTSPQRTDVASEDEVVFVTPSEPSPLEEAFDDAPVRGGEAARPAADGPSLASLFGDESDTTSDEPGRGTAQTDDPTGLTYDGFFAGQDRTSPEAVEDEGEEDDDEEFKAWLQSLKS